MLLPPPSGQITKGLQGIIYGNDNRIRKPGSQRSVFPAFRLPVVLLDHDPRSASLDCFSNKIVAIVLFSFQRPKELASPYASRISAEPSQYGLMLSRNPIPIHRDNDFFCGYFTPYSGHAIFPIDIISPPPLYATSDCGGSKRRSSLAIELQVVG